MNIYRTTQGITMEEQNRQIDRIEQITKCNMEDQSFYMGFNKRVAIRERVLIMNHHRVLIHKVKQKWPNVPIAEVSYAALILASKAVYAERQKMLKLDFSDLELEEIRDVSIKKIELHIDKVFSRDSPQREKLLKVWGDIKELRKLKRKKASSFQGISVYVKKVHKLDVGQSTIWKLWNELEVNNNQKLGEK